ncbi:MAG: fasciclin domain-containing protein [Bacteriovoracaceae bacterium]|nr:fasciclin domain-containing protein [Bacteriovoracaceae bacterium]
MKRHLGIVRSCLIGVAAMGIISASGLWCRADGADAKDIVDTLEDIGMLATFTRSVHLGQIHEMLREGGPFTVFAPNEEAFLNLPAETIEMLFDHNNRDELDGLIAYHVVPDEIRSSGMRDGSSATALNEEVLHITRKNGALFVQNARIIRADIVCSNGIIHIIDKVILNGD